MNTVDMLWNNKRVSVKVYLDDFDYLMIQNPDDMDRFKRAHIFKMSHAQQQKIVNLIKYGTPLK